MGEAPRSFGFTVWFCMTVCAALVFVSLTSLIPLHYKLIEPVFTDPVSPEEPVRLRYDAMGDGYFGASRGNGSRSHNGLDLSANVGDDVLASKSGRVVFAGNNGGYGQYVQLLHPDGTNTRYAHLSEILAEKGAWVARDTVIGLVGKTGNANSRVILPHLHFEIRRGEEPIDPTQILKVSPNEIKKT